MATQLNFAQQMDAVLKTLGDARPRLLLHACCGPCSSAVLEQLCQYFDITVLYYNPNTWPAEEYHRRGEELKKFVAAAHPLGVTVVEDTYDPQEFYTAVQGLEAEPERGGRCTVCYRLRMRRAAQYGRCAHQRHRAGAGSGVRREAPALGLQKTQRLSAQSAAFGGIWPVPAGLLRVRVQRKGQRDRKIRFIIVNRQSLQTLPVCFFTGEGVPGSGIGCCWPAAKAQKENCIGFCRAAVLARNWSVV